MQAAIGHQHATAAADVRIAAALENALSSGQYQADDEDDEDDGAAGVLVPAR